MTETIAAIATPPGQGAIAVLRISGPAARSISLKLLPVARLRPRVQTLADLRHPAGELIDQVLATYFPAPHSYTGEDVVEISCHGGLLITQTIYEALLEAGARPAGPGEFTQRAFLHQKLDLTQAEAVMDLIAAQTSWARQTALAQLRGRLGQRIEELRQELIAILAHTEAYIDFPDEDIEPATAEQLASRLTALISQMETLASTALQGRMLREGVRTVICGAPNAGKSSLLNQLSGYDRAIVASQAGTTRDTIEETINLRGIPLRLVDTAGLRNPLDPVEREGIARTHQEIASAQLILEIVDGHEAPCGDRPPILPAAGTIHLTVLNKADLGLHDFWQAQLKEALPVISCATGSGLDSLKDRILSELLHGQPVQNEPGIAINARHHQALRLAMTRLEEARTGLLAALSPELTAVDLHSALQALDEILGKTDIDSILSEIFASFCIGK